MGDRVGDTDGPVGSAVGACVGVMGKRAARLGYVMLPQPVTGSHPDVVVKPEAQQVGEAVPFKAQHLLSPDVISLYVF